MRKRDRVEWDEGSEITVRGSQKGHRTRLEKCRSEDISWCSEHITK